MRKMNYIKNIPEFGFIKKFYLIKNGLYESKFRAIGDDNKEYLLIIYSSNTIDSYKLDTHQLLSKHKIPTNKIVSFGMCNYNKSFYILFDWLQGDSLLHNISKFNNNEQYELGLTTGEMLKKIHSIDCPQLISKECRIIDRIDCLIRKYENEASKMYPFLYCFIDFVKQNRNIVVRNPVFLHGDFSLNNLIIDRTKQLSIIDWVYGSFGHPAEDFVRNLVNADVSQNFACGLLDGYFQNIIPESFWFDLKLYTAIHQIELIELSVKLGYQNDLFVQYNHELAYRQYQNMGQLIPYYYLSGRHKNEH